MAIGTAAVLLTSGAAYGVDLLIDTEGHTTVEQLIVPTGAGTFKDLTLQPGGEPYVVRDGDQNEAGSPIPDGIQAQAGREQRRISLAYVSQMTDFQLADEESPARVEFLDVNFNDPEGCPPEFCGPFPNNGPASAHRPQEALTGFQIDATIRQLNAFVPASPVTDGEGNRRSMDFSLATGDQADNNQRNETEWVRDLLEGNGPISFNSGSANPLDYDDPEELLLPGCAAYAAPLMGEGLPGVVSLSDAPKYTGVQDYDDYDESQTPLYYDPDDPRGLYADWPTYTGLMDRAQQIEIDPEGLDVPSYVTNGNHDVLVQGNEDANNEFERIATGCTKVLASTAEGQPGLPDPNVLLAPASAAITVPRDPLRRMVSKPQIKAIFGANDPDAHGFDFVDPAEEVASRPAADTATGPGAASYYAWDPVETPGFRFISIDTNSEGGQTAEGVASGSSNGNIDDPQFQWLKDELEAAEDRDQLVVLFGHHPVRSMSTEIRDEQAPQCVPPKHAHGDTPEHYANPGCDHDTRPSEPIHVGQDPQAGDPRESFVELLNLHPNVVGYIAGHTHEHRLLPFARTDGSVWWEINTAAVLDWNTQSRLIEVMDNRDGTLSIFGTAIDHASDPTAPAEGSAADFDGNELASIGRTLAFNDPQAGPGGGGAGRGVFDRNAEMLVGDPREADLKVVKADNPDPVTAGQPLTYTITVTNQDPPGDVSGAQGVTLTDDLPTTAEFVSAVPSPPGAICNSPAAGEDLVCSLGDLPSGASATVTVTVTPQTAGTITNTATVASLFDDPDLGNNTDSEDTSVDPTAAEADVELVSKTGSPSPVTAGDPLTYAISVRNNGDDAAPGVAVTDALPGGVVLSSATTPQGTCETDLGVVTCTMGTLADGETGSAQIVVVPQVPGSLTNTATVSSGATDPIPGNNSAQANTQVLARPSGAAPAREGRCRGRNATIVGTSADETITGTPGADVIDAGDGNDTVLGRKRMDVICGRRGDDELFGGSGPDKLIGGPGNDRLFGGRGRDRANGKGGKDFCRSAKPNSCRSKR